MSVEKVEKKFDEFINSFDLSNYKLALKNVHTYEVAKVMKTLCDKLNLNDRDRYLAMITAYFHDAGRFPQLYETDSFSDKEYDHALKSVEVIDKMDILNYLELNDEEKTIVRKAVLNHNKFEVEEGLNERELYFSNLIRDADKIDIFRVSVDNYKDNFEFDPNPKVIKAFFEEKSIYFKDIETRTDHIILKLAFLYDLNFQESFDILKENNYFIIYLNSITVGEAQKDIYAKILSKIISYYEGRISC